MKALGVGAALLAVAALGLGLHGCLSVTEVPARGCVAGYELSGPVDSPLARDYLEGRPLPAELAKTRADYLAARKVPSKRVLAALSEKYSPDVATLLFLETMSALPSSRDLRERYEREVAYLRQVGLDNAQPYVPDDFLILVAPGWFYKSHGEETNGDLRRQRAMFERMGVNTRLIEVDENGTVEDNAKRIATAIRRASRSHSLYLVSASKGGPEVAQALGRELAPDETKKVMGWLSIGGVLRGSPFADRVLEPDLCWFVEAKLGLEGFDLDGAKSLQTQRAGQVFRELEFPPHIRIVSYIAAPLSGNVTSRGEFGYGRLRSFGPNDGLTLLVDELVPGGTPLLVPGIDHFFDDQEQDLWSAALLRVLVAEQASEG